MEETKSQKIWSIINKISFGLYMLVITLILLLFIDEHLSLAYDDGPYSWFGRFVYSHFDEFLVTTFIFFVAITLVGGTNVFVRKKQSLRKTSIGICLINLSFLAYCYSWYLSFTSFLLLGL